MNPLGLAGVNANSNPGTRDVVIDITPQAVATLPNAEQTIFIDYSGPAGAQPNTNLQLRYEMDSTLLNPTTDANGQATAVLNSSDVVDTTNASDDYSSNGLIVWDPLTEIIGTATIVIDLSLTPVDLIAQSDAIIVTRTRDGVESILTKSIGYNALPGDSLSFSYQLKIVACWRHRQQPSMSPPQVARSSVNHSHQYHPMENQELMLNGLFLQMNQSAFKTLVLR